MQVLRVGLGRGAGAKAAWVHAGVVRRWLAYRLGVKGAVWGAGKGSKALERV
jgi:hypothetical protein